jgi:arginase
LEAAGASSSPQRPRLALLEVACDLGAATAGAAAGSALLRRAAQRHPTLGPLQQRLLEPGPLEPLSLEPPQPEAGPEAAGRTPHARHIHRLADVMERTAAMVSVLRQRGLFPLVLAGDHSTAAATIAGLRRAHPGQRLGVVWIDAHADIHSPFTTPSGNMHGMPLAIATRHDNHAHAIQTPDPATLDVWRRLQDLAQPGQPALQLRDLIYIAVRSTEAAERATIRAHGLPVVSTAEVRRRGPEAAAARCLEHLAACDLIYVSFDVDSMDATICRGTGTPVPGGLWADEAVRILRALLRDPRVCCWEICEINPHLASPAATLDLALEIYRGVLEELDRRFAGADRAQPPGPQAPWPLPHGRGERAA